MPEAEKKVKAQQVDEASVLGTLLNTVAVFSREGSTTGWGAHHTDPRVTGGARAEARA